MNAPYCASVLIHDYGYRAWDPCTSHSQWSRSRSPKMPSIVEVYNIYMAQHVIIVIIQDNIAYVGTPTKSCAIKSRLNL